MITFIYALLDPRTDEIRYIGKTVNPNARLRQHIKTRRTVTHCTLWIDTLLAESVKPVMKVLETCDKSNGSTQERWWIAEGKKAGLRLTNLTDGGEGVTMTPERKKHLSELFTGRKISEEQKAKISASLMGHSTSEKTREVLLKGSKMSFPNPHSEETRQRMSAAHTGKKRTPHSEETKEKMRKAALGKKHGSPSEETRAKLSAANTGKTLSEDHKAKISAANTGREFSEEHKQHLSEAHLGNTPSQETKDKISAAHLARHNQEEQ